MFKMSRKLEYSLMVLNEMKDSGDLFTVKQLSQKLKSPFDVTAKVMQRMAKLGLISSEQGVSGGYRTNNLLAKTSLRSLFEAISGPGSLVRCVGEDCDLIAHCKVKAPLKKLDQKLKFFYESISIEELFSSDSLAFEANPKANGTQEVLTS